MTRAVNTSWESINVADGSEMRLFVARPQPFDHSVPVVSVLQEAFGVNMHIQDVAARFAALGYVAVAPELFHRTAPGFEGDYRNLETSKPHMQALTPQHIKEDLCAVQTWLLADKQADAEKMAAVGYCLGGKAAFVANAILPMKAAVSYYGAGIPSLLGDYARRQQAPLLLFWGGKDKNADAEKRASVSSALREEGKAFTIVEFSEAGHGFFCDHREAYNPRAARESWALVEAYLEDAFIGEPPRATKS